MLKYIRGSVVIVDLGEIRTKSYLTGKERPCVIMTNDKANEHSGILTVVPLTTKLDKYPFHPTVDVNGKSQALVEQICTINVSSVKEIMGFLNSKDMAKIEQAVLCQLGLLNDNRIQEEDYQKLKEENLQKEEVLKDKPQKVEVIKEKQQNREVLKDKPIIKVVTIKKKNNNKNKKQKIYFTPRKEDEKLQIICDYDTLSTEEMMKKYGWNSKNTVCTTVHKIKKEFNML